MKFVRATLLCLLIVFGVAGTASATHIEDFAVDVDCEGWSMSFAVYYYTMTLTATLDYEVVLLDADSMEVARIAMTEDIGANGSSYLEYYDYSGSWDLELCGDYTAMIDIYVLPEGQTTARHASGSATFTCECDEPGGCFLTPGYWKNHAKNWPADTLMLGGVERSQDELLMILRSSVRGGDATVILAHHLIAAKLNVLNGADPSIQSVIDDADDYLAMHDVFSNPGDDEGRQDALDLKDMLADYNEQGCPEEDDDGDDEEEFEKSAVATDETTWDNLKAIYR